MADRLNRVGLSKVNRFARRALGFVTGDTLVANLGELTVQGSTESWSLLRKLRAGTFEPYERRLFVDVLRPGMTVLDLGANIGVYTLLAAKAVGSTGRVFAFEPDPRVLPNLRANILSNGFKNVVVIDKAVSDRPGKRTFYASSTASHSGLHRWMTRDSAVRELTVDTARIDDVLGHERIDVIKMDIEGEEPAALAGMTETLAGSPNTALFVEFKPDALAAAGRSADEFLEQLRTSFGSVSVIDEPNQRLAPVTGETIGRPTNLLCQSHLAG